VKHPARRKGREGPHSHAGRKVQKKHEPVRDGGKRGCFFKKMRGSKPRWTGDRGLKGKLGGGEVLSMKKGQKRGKWSDQSPVEMGVLGEKKGLEESAGVGGKEEGPKGTSKGRGGGKKKVRNRRKGFSKQGRYF